MKKYKEPRIDLFFLASEDVLTVSDPTGDDIFDNIEL